jgi:hypothetical protein
LAGQGSGWSGLKDLFDRDVTTRGNYARFLLLSIVDLRDALNFDRDVRQVGKGRQLLPVVRRLVLF